MSARFRIGLVAAAAMVWAVSASAQIYQQVAPKRPAQSQSGVIETGPASAVPLQPKTASPDDKKIVLPKLLGLRFIPHANDVIKVGVVNPGLDVATVPGLDDSDLDDALQSYIGKPLTFGDLHEITRIVIAFLRGHGRPLVDVALPEQDVTSGVIQIVVTEFTLGRVRVKGSHRFATSIFQDGIETALGQPIDLDQLKHDLDWLNRNPFRKVDVVLARGEKPGTTDIQLDVQEQFPFRTYFGFSNSGLTATGRDQWSLGVNFGNLFGLDQQLAYQFTAGDDFVRHITDGKARFMAHSASYIAPLPWHDLIEVFGAYVRQIPNIGPFFGQIGQSSAISARYIHTFGGPAWLNQELQFGFDYKTTNNNIAFGGLQIFAASQDIDQFALVYSATAVDPWGVTTLENDFYYSPGNLTANNSNAAFAQSGTAFANANYEYDTLSLTRATELPFNSSWVTRIKAQVASGNLLPSEQLGAGGDDSVRGYDTRVINGTQGVLVSEELRSPPFSLIDWALRRSAGDSAQLLGFWDYARLGDPHVQPHFLPHYSLESAGVGFSYAIGRTLDLRSDYGWQLLKLPGAKKLGAQANIAITLSY